MTWAGGSSFTPSGISKRPNRSFPLERFVDANTDRPALLTAGFALIKAWKGERQGNLFSVRPGELPSLILAAAQRFISEETNFLHALDKNLTFRRTQVCYS